MDGRKAKGYKRILSTPFGSPASRGFWFCKAPAVQNGHFAFYGSSRGFPRYRSAALSISFPRCMSEALEIVPGPR